MEIIRNIRLTMTSCIINGGSGVGKTWLCLELIRRRKVCFNNKINSVVHVYKNWQEQFNEFSEDEEVFFIQDIFQTDSVVSKFPKKSFLIFIDDQIISFENDKKVTQYVEEFFVFRSHHEKLHPVFICHNIFSKSLRLVSLNAGLIVFRNKGLKSTICSWQSAWIWELSKEHFKKNN